MASARAFLVMVDAHIAADPSFMKDRAKVIFFVVIIVESIVDQEVQFHRVHPSTGLAG